MNSTYEPMGESEVKELLLGWFESREYLAAWQYVTTRNQQAMDGLRSVDPFRNPTDIARTQGISTGLFDLFDYVKLLVKKEQENQISKEGVK